MTDNPITREGWRRIEEVLDEALELTPEEVPAFLDRACAGDAELRRQVDELLAADRQAQGFLAPPDAQTVASLLTDPETPFLAERGNELEGREIGPYRILRRIGAGGMGVVYLARDTRLDRTVAVKLLPADWAGTPAARERFLREARLISALDHPHICTLHDIGETGDGRLYLVMAYYQGETLKARLAGGPMPVADAVDFAVQVGRGLARAHAAGIVHRDIKPANVIVTEHGEAKILDFGIAKSARDAALTRTGSSLGTPGYMSPEQARGAAVDERTDVWSLGVMLYEMIAGRQPFAADHPQAQIHAILERNPEPLDRRRSDVPPAVTRAVGKALVKDPAGRTPSAAAFVAELTAATGPQALAAAAHRRHWRALAGAGLCAAALIGFGAWSIWHGLAGTIRTVLPQAAREAKAAQAPVVAVLPFVNHTGEPLLEWVGDGAAQLVWNSLRSSRHLQVLPVLLPDPPTAGRSEQERLRHAAAGGIDIVLSGEVLPAPRGFILAARYFDKRTGSQVLARPVDVPSPKDLLRAAGEVAHEARNALKVPSTETVDVFTADFPIETPEAYESYVAGLQAFSRKRYDRAEEAFRRALRQAPSYTMARYRLAHTLAVTGNQTGAEIEIRKAAAEVGGLPDREAGYVRAMEAYVSRRYPEATNAYRYITDHYPNESEARYLLAWLLKSQGRYDEAVELIRDLISLNPNDADVWDLSGETHLAQGHFSDALDDFRRYCELEPESAGGYKLLGDTYRATASYAPAAEKYRKALELDPRLAEAKVALAVNEALSSNDWVEAHRLLEEVVADSGAHTRERLDAAFEQASLLRAEGRFERAAATLDSVKDLLAKEKLREAMALSIRGLSRLELGDSASARTLLDGAVARSRRPDFKGAPTRYLFARGLLDIQSGDAADLEKTVNEILGVAHRRPPGDPDQKEEKAVACLQGIQALSQGRSREAVDRFGSASAYRGIDYVSCKLWLARAYLKAGNPASALAAAREAQASDPVHPRLDLELDRVRALLVQGEAMSALGNPRGAVPLARQFLARWQGADHGLKDFAEARRLAGLPPV